jgi:hypothetical protein
MVFGIISVVIPISSLLFEPRLLGLFGMLCGVLAVVLFAKFKGDYDGSRRRLGGMGLSVVGLVTGIVGTVLCIPFVLFLVAFLA